MDCPSAAACFTWPGPWGNQPTAAAAAFRCRMFHLARPTGQPADCCCRCHIFPLARSLGRPADAIERFSVCEHRLPRTLLLLRIPVKTCSRTPDSPGLPPSKQMQVTPPADHAVSQASGCFTDLKNYACTGGAAEDEAAEEELAPGGGKSSAGDRVGGQWCTPYGKRSAPSHFESNITA